jgi:DNA polymerase-3 subunit delta'
MPASKKMTEAKPAETAAAAKAAPAVATATAAAAAKAVPVEAALATMSVFDDFPGQKRITQYLSNAFASNMLTHAYLFIGPIGAGKTEMALAFAKALICENDGCGKCDACRRVKNNTHPDLHLVEPEGIGTYTAEQIRQITSEVQYAPIRAKRKVYIISRADYLKGSSANALLKTLEEPLEDTVFILLARTKDSVLPTIGTRCQSLMFRALSHDEATELIFMHTGIEPKDATLALTVSGGSVLKAIAYLNSKTKQEVRMTVIKAMELLRFSDDVVLIKSVREILKAIKAPIDELNLELTSQMNENEEFLSSTAKGAMAKRQKRQLANSERDSIAELLNIIQSWLRDAMAMSLGMSKRIINYDCYYNIETLGKSLSADTFIAAIDSVQRAREDILYNVSSQLVLEKLLFNIRKELNADRSTG